MVERVGVAIGHQILRPGGHALVVMPDPAGRGRRLAGDGWMGFEDPTHINLKTHDEWRAFLTARGFVVEREEPFRGGVGVYLAKTL